jgi:hypothetical protein
MVLQQNDFYITEYLQTFFFICACHFDIYTNQKGRRSQFLYTNLKI